MERKETDKELNGLLRKDPSYVYDYLEGQYKKYNFPPAYVAECYMQSKFMNKVQ